MQLAYSQKFVYSCHCDVPMVDFLSLGKEQKNNVDNLFAVVLQYD